MLYLPNEDSKEDLPSGVERRPEFNKSLSSEKVNKNSYESVNNSAGVLKSSIANDNNEMNRKLSKTEKVVGPIVNSTERKKNEINNYHRRHSWIIAISKLDSNKELNKLKYQNGLNNINQGQGNKNTTKKKKRKHKGSCDSCTLSNHSGNTGPVSNQLLLKKVQEVKANNNGIPLNNYQNSSQGNLNGPVECSQGRNTLQSKRLDSRKYSKESGYNGTELLDESFIPPMMIDNSAVIFDPAKNKKTKFTKRNLGNPLHSDIDGNESEVGYEENKRGKRGSEGSSEGEYDGEGESISSSCTCSSCMKEKNADNGMSLKLSQYSYKPTYGGFQRNETEGEINFMNTSGFRDIVNTSMYEDKSTTNKELNNSRLDKSMKDVSNGVPPRNYFNENQKSRSDFPDNLNNGKFQMKIAG